MKASSRNLICACALLAAGLGFSAPSFAQNVTYNEILHADQHPQDWLTYGGNYSAWRYSELKQVDTSNVNQLKMQWVYQLSHQGIFESSPIVVGGIMYVTEPPTTVTALDVRTGRPIWTWTAKLPARLLTIGLFPTNRGVAILGDTVYVATIDAHLAALDAKTGALKWEVEIGKNSDGIAITQAPLALDGKIVVGIGGGEAGIRGYIDAYDAKTGKRLWRLYTVPIAGEPGVNTWEGDSWKYGGAGTWNTGSYDPETNTIFWGTGNPAPDWNGEARKGANLYSCTLLAIDANSGKMKWYFQFSPHETHDWDSAEPPILFDAKVNGKMTHLVAQANRNAFYYVLDRDTGKFITGQAFAKQTWAKGLAADGQPIEEPNNQPTVKGNLIYPSITGAVNWTSPSYSPLTGYVYVNTREQGAIYYQGNPTMEPANPADVGGGGGQKVLGGDQAYSAVRALEGTTGDRKWQFKMVGDSWTGTLATAGNLVFCADAEGNFFALNATTGKPIWHVQLGNSVRANPITYEVDGKQYVEAAAGNSIFTFALP
ncbi:MAG TPA: PQQ-dependent dehydrogenase, methanol/ethanol family [Candidatus Dormibacteraeota bacterium]|nr:PQQ-dependent dehydrogenase, methanol/ethanol family [Candidatus Dormibacteraeota bacterium]